VISSEFREDAGETITIGLLYGEKTMTIMLSRFHLIPERNRRTDRRTDRFDISISRVSMLTRDNYAKNSLALFFCGHSVERTPLQ